MLSLEESDVFLRDRNIRVVDSTALNNPANILIQYGEPRSATTLQFITLCLIRCLLHGPATQCIKGITKGSRCNDLLQTRGADARKLAIVCKTHKIADALQIGSHPGTVIFATGHRNESVWVKKSKHSNVESWFTVARGMKQHWRDSGKVPPEILNTGWNLSYVALAEILASRDDMLLRDYADLFGLSLLQYNQVLAFLIPWSKLRICCGAQMSEEYRKRLIGEVEGAQVRRPFPGPSHRSDICEKYDLGKIEKQLLSTEVFSKARHVRTIRQLSEYDGELDGTYCVRAQKATVRLRLIFNDERYKQLGDDIKKKKRLKIPRVPTRRPSDGRRVTSSKLSPERIQTPPVR